MSHWQYQSHSEPVLPTPRTGGISYWHVPLSLPVRRRSLTAAVISTTVLAFVPVIAAPEIPTVDKWHTELSRPTLQQRRLQYEIGAENPLEIPKFQQLDWYIPLSEPVRIVRHLQYETGAENPLEVPEFQQLDWYQELSRPVSRIRNLQYITNAETPVTVPVIQPTVIDWFVELSRPVRRSVKSLPGLGADSPLTVPAPIPSANEWYPSLTVPVRRTVRQRSQYNTGAEFVPQPPEYSACSWYEHFNSRGWANIQDQIDAGYPIYAQPTELTGSYEEVIDYGTLLSNNIVTLRWSALQLAGSTTIVSKIASSVDNITYTDFVTGVSVFYSSLRYLKIRFEFTGADDTALLEFSQIQVLLDVKREVDSGSVAADENDANGTEVLFNKEFKDVDSITLDASSTVPLTAIYDFTDVPNPTGFTVYVFDSTGNRVSANVSWKARGIV